MIENNINIMKVLSIRFRKKHFEKIICPECEHIQLAKVMDMEPWNVFIRKCRKCGYMITESDWEKI